MSETHPCYNSLARNILLKMSSGCLGPGMGQQKQGSVGHSAGVRGVLSSLKKFCLCFLKFGNLVAVCRLHWRLSTYASLGLGSFRFLGGSFDAHRNLSERNLRHPPPTHTHRFEIGTQGSDSLGYHTSGKGKVGFGPSCLIRQQALCLGLLLFLCDL